MSLPYDPLSADIRTDATISATTYIVTAFDDAGATPVETPFQNSNGSWRGRHIVAGERTATMTIEVTNAAQATPVAGVTFDYAGQTWVIKQASRAKGGGGTAASINLTLGWVSAAS